MEAALQLGLGPFGRRRLGPSMLGLLGRRCLWLRRACAVPSDPGDGPQGTE